MKMLRRRADAVGAIGWQVTVDSAVARAHQHAADARLDLGAQLEPSGGVDTEPADHGFGRSRGGWGTKLHVEAIHVWDPGDYRELGRSTRQPPRP
ncbi:hypothetical protein AB0C65_36520 [Nocardia sp. NPDC048505]|uniref:hypothetical protein n=1 Tax=Nocardia sp. NPDC048505 TaxID=3155756 RepID=UPI0034084567